MGKGFRLKEFREHLGLNQIDFGKQIDVSQTYLSSMESESKRVSADTSASVAAKFPQLNLDWLERGRGEMIWKGRPTQSNLPNNNFTYPSSTNEGELESKNDLIKVSEFDNYVVYRKTK